VAGGPQAAANSFDHPDSQGQLVVKYAGVLGVLRSRIGPEPGSVLLRIVHVGALRISVL
jgi:hypothetical protein